MPSSNGTQFSASSMNSTCSTPDQSHMLQEYLRAAPTETDRCAGLVDLDLNSHVDNVKDRIKDFDNIFAKSDKDKK
ncbi:hypothetical protein F5B19DRAFT_61222 [Rostrohypoxylon terebratum]|nr:hypothetical protein F5B19DRAFT_61222 [Rostrohypoxylon terebratum]